MANNSYTMAKDLLDYVENKVLYQCRKEFLQYNEQQNKLSNPWNIAKSAMDDSVKNEKEVKPKNISASDFVEMGVSHFIDNMVLREKETKKISVISSVNKILNECHIICNLLTINLGNYGMPWNAVDLLNEAKPYGFAVRFGVLIPKIADLQQLMPDLDWNVSMPAILPFVDGGTLFIAGFGDKRDTVITCLHSIALRTLTCVPLGTMRVIVLDPLGFSIGIYPWSYWPGSV